jgi:hypothetical protein
MSLNPIEDKPSIAYPSLEILIQQIHWTEQCSIQYSQVLEHHEHVYPLIRLITPQLDKFFSCLKYLSVKS